MPTANTSLRTGQEAVAAPIPVSTTAPVRAPIMLPQAEEGGDWDAGYLTCSAHSGHCCGVSVIWRFPAGPDFILKARKARDSNALSTAITVAPAVAYEYNEAYPRQYAKDRLAEAVKRLETKRPQGILEVLLTQHQAPVWQKTLLDLGFVAVKSAKNSNSHNTITVFLKVTGQ